MYYPLDLNAEIYFILGFIWEFIRECNGKIIREWKGKERKGMEWNVFKQGKRMKKNGIK